MVIRAPQRPLGLLGGGLCKCKKSEELSNEVFMECESGPFWVTGETTLFFVILPPTHGYHLLLILCITFVVEPRAGNKSFCVNVLGTDCGSFIAEDMSVCLCICA